MEYKLSYHAKQQIDQRGFDEREILAKLARLDKQIAAVKDTNVKVIIRNLYQHVILPDGSSGNLIVAAVDSYDGTIKTVFLQNTWQVETQSRHGQKFVK